MDIEEEKQQLLLEMKTTKGCRFNAAERLVERDRKIIKITSFASIYVVILTVLPFFFHIPDIIRPFLDLVILAFSLVILAASLLQYSNNDPVTAEQHHRCALEVNALRRELRATDTSKEQVLLDFGSRYDAILQKYNVNHGPPDFEKYKREHPEEYGAVGSQEEQQKVRKRFKTADVYWHTVLGMTGAMAALIGSILVQKILEFGFSIKLPLAINLL